MSRQFDWLVAGAWAGVVVCCITFWVGVALLVGWIA